MSKSDIAIVTVNYFGSDDTNNFLKSLVAAGANPAITLVVDNSCSASEFLTLTKKLEVHDFSCLNVVILRSSSNLGYFGGCNLGLDFLKDNKIDFDWLIFCNNDILVESNFWIALNGASTSADSNVLALAPRITDRVSKRDLNPFLLTRPTKYGLRKLKLITSSFWVAYLHKAVSEVRSRLRFRKVYSTAERCATPIYAGHGSFFIMRKVMLHTPLDYEYYMYAEEITVAERCRFLGGIYLYTPTIRAVHASHAQTGAFLSRKTFSWKKNALRHIMKSYDWN